MIRKFARRSAEKDGGSGMQEMSDVLGVLHDRSAGRWAVGLAATAAFMVGGAYLGSVGSAQAGGDLGNNNNVGSWGRDGLGVTCNAYSVSLRDDALICNVIVNGYGGAPGEGGSATIYCRTVPPQDDASQVQCTATSGSPGGANDY
jgi:hypothetical protein